MSRKSKLILATAVFGAALFGASCGGGGEAAAETGNGSTGNGSNGGGTQPPPASVEGRVLALLEVNASKRVSICELKNNTKAECGNDISSGANATLSYIHEFSNGNVVLAGSGNVLYFFNAQNNTLTKLTSFRDLDGISGTVATGITIPAGVLNTVVRFNATANFLMIYNGNNLVAISNTGNVIMDNAVGNINPACERAVKGANTYSLDVNGNSSITTIVPTMQASAGGKFVVTVPTGVGGNNDVYLSDSRCALVNSVLIMSAVNNFQDAKMVEFGGNYYIAIRYGAAGTTLDYYRVTGTTVAQLQAGLALRAANPNLYDIDGRGYLYYNSATNNIRASTPTGGAAGHLAALAVGGGNVDGILAFNDRVLVRTSAGVQLHDVFINNAGVLANTPNPPGADLTALQRCTTQVVGNTGTRAVEGRGTPFVRCVFDDNAGGGLQDRLSVFVHNGNGNYSSNTIRINNNSINGTAANNITQNNIRFGATNVLVVTRDDGGNVAGNGRLDPIYLCTITTAPAFNVSCSETDLPNPIGNIPLRDTTRIYPFTAMLKFNGNNVFYLSGTSVRLRNLFSTTASSLPIAVVGASGGNASSDLTKFAYSFTPNTTPPPPCATGIAYLSSPTAPETLYTLNTPNTCVVRILKTFP
jgi:hypothetical protein